MGWQEGEGLGKDATGITSHIKVKQRTEDEGIGHEKEGAKVAGDTWWANSLEKTMFLMNARKEEEKRLKKERKEEKKKRKKEEGGDETTSPSAKKPKKSKRKLSDSALLSSYVEKDAPTDSELMAATGGARFGMRAQFRAEGKWSRAEGDALKEEEGLVVAEWDGTGKAKILGRKEEKRLKKAEEEAAEAITEKDEVEHVADVDPPKKEKKEKKGKKEKK